MTAKVFKEKEGRNINCHRLKGKLGVLKNTAHRILKENGFRRVKELVKPGPTEAMKKARLEFCKAHEHWALEDWKKIIWTDETSVVLGHRRGNYRIWRRDFERHLNTCVRSCFKQASEFMFWGAFS
jgi:hypothetical protein